MTELLERIGHNVRRLREEKGWNQTELGYNAQTSPSIISLIENGKRNPSTVTLAKIATALDVELEALLGPKVPSRSALEPTLLNGLEEERRTDGTLVEYVVDDLSDVTDVLGEYLYAARMPRVCIELLEDGRIRLEGEQP